MVKWNNRNLKELGIIVERIPAITKGKKKIETMQVPGRNGFISIDTGVYEPFNLSLECHCTDNANINEIKTFLDGYGTLTFDGIKQYTAIVNNAIPFETILPIFKKFLVSFLVNPIAEDITPTTVNILNEESIDIETYSIILPILTISCSGDISVTINNSTFYLNDTNGTYILDCKNKVITDNNGNNVSNLMLGDFPTFLDGSNSINKTGTITAFTTEYRKTYL